MKVLITGGAGFLGSHLVDYLLEHGAEVLAIDNFVTGKRSNLKSHSSLSVVESNIADIELVNRTFKDFKPDQVIHAAASYKDPDDWFEDVNTNILGTAYVIQAAKRVNAKRLIYLQTALCYGRPKEHPITLSHPLEPFTSYAISKTAGENYITLSGLPYVSLRLANIYGPRHFSGPIPTFYKRLKAKQDCFVVNSRRDFLSINDFLYLMDAVMKNEEEIGCYNVSSGTDYTIKEVFDLVVECMNVKLDQKVEVCPPDKDDVSSLLLDPSETEKSFGWKARISLKEGLNKLIGWYEEHGVDEAYTHLTLGKQE